MSTAKLHPGILETVSSSALRNAFRRPALAAVVTASALLLGGCLSTGEEPEGPEVEDSVDLQVDPARVMVQSSGQGPGQVLSFSDTGEQETTVEIAEGFDQSAGGTDAIDVAAPEGTDIDTETVTLPLTASSAPADEPEGETEVAADREVSWRVGTPEHTDTALSGDLASAEGFALDLRSDGNGQVSTVGFAAPVDATDEGRSTVESALMKLLSLPVVFPDEPVGPGAVWSVDSRVTGEATLLQTTTYTLTAADGDRVELDVSVTQRPALGALSLEGQPGAPEDAGTLNVLNSNTTSSGSLTVDLTKPLPVAGRVDYTTRVVYGTEGSDVRVAQDSTSTLSFG